jgi:hypothetical protein
MLRPIPIAELGKIDLIPQAILNRPVSYFEKHGIQFVQADDELDNYEGAALVLDNNLRFALKHHRGYPNDTITIYLSKEIQNLQQITSIVRRIVEELKLTPEVIRWQRSDNPDF